MITPESIEAERQRLYAKARHDEAQALFHAEEREREKWQGVVAEKDAALAEKDAENARLRQQIAALQSRLSEGK